MAELNHTMRGERSPSSLWTVAGLRARGREYAECPVLLLLFEFTRYYSSFTFTQLPAFFKEVALVLQPLLPEVVFYYTLP